MWAGLLLLWAVISTMSAALLFSGGSILITKQSISALWAMMCGLAVYATIVSLKPDEKWILNMLCITLFLHVFCQLSQFLHGKPGVGIMYNPNGSSGFVALSSVAFLRPKWIWFWFVPITGLVYAKSFGGVFGASLVAIVYGGIHGFKFLPGFLVCIGMVFYAVFIDRPGITRAGCWEFVIPWTFQNHWTTGCGAGNWKVFFWKLYRADILKDPSWIRIHNTWLEGFTEMGVVFPILIIGFVADNIRRFLKSFPIRIDLALNFASLGAICGVGFANSFFKFNQLNGLIAIVWLALLETKLNVPDMIICRDGHI